MKTNTTLLIFAAMTLTACHQNSGRTPDQAVLSGIRVPGNHEIIRELSDTARVLAADCGDQNEKKVLICHIPHGNPGAFHTICIKEKAIDDHLKKYHGGKSNDHLGDCG